MLGINIATVFIGGCILGYIIEVIYRSLVEEKKLVNPGFLSGPYLPIYGIGVLILFEISNYANHLGIFLTTLLFAIATTLLELVTGLIFEHFYQIRLWDYSDKPANFKGHICLEFTVYWTMLSLIFKKYIHPIIQKFLLIELSQEISIFIGFLYGMFFMDMIKSLNVSYKLKKLVRHYKPKKMTKRVLLNLHKMPHKVRRKMSIYMNVKEIKKVLNKSKMIKLIKR